MPFHVQPPRSSRLLSLVLVLLACGAPSADQLDSGSDTDAGDQLDCMELSLLWAAEIANATSELRSCASDADCARIEAELICDAPDVHVDLCGHAVRFDSTVVAADRLEALRPEICARAAESCVSSSACPATLTTRCRGGECRLEPR